MQKGGEVVSLTDEDQTQGTTKDVEFPGWVGDFLYYTSELPTPHIFRLWTAISTISGVLERRVWINSAGKRTYPNLFIMLVAPPGIGKSVAINEAIKLWEETGGLNIAPSSLPGKGLVDELDDESKQKTAIDPETDKREIYHPLNIPAPEMGTLIPSHDLGFVSMLNDLFDCGPKYDERTRTGGQYYIEKPHINLIVGTQPKYLGSTFPEEAFGMGFTSRIIMVYTAEEVKIDDLFECGENTRTQEVQNRLIKHLQELAECIGPFEVDQDVKEAFMEWYREGLPPAPQHTKLAHYNTRRWLHLMKLMQIFSASRSGEQHVIMQDFQLAKLVLLEAEQAMPEIFKEISSGSQSGEIEEAFNYLYNEYIKGGQKPIREQKLHAFLHRRVPVWQIDQIIQTMENAGLVEQVIDDTKTKGRKFRPIIPG